ncbi:hypothetical protein AAF712_007368 [Marasmius tenuissimus]|uniref:DUF7888 domain-containing protein n=1 Tax=Marasmius tenuissimus TaxID=585030 RepID=A0ABR2ZW90_9AGAR
MAAVANAAAIPANTSNITDQALAGHIAVSDGISVKVLELKGDASADVALVKRGATASRTRGGGADAGAAIGQALGEILAKLFPIGKWNEARETFTKATTAEMWARNPNRGKWVAAICYNKGWRVKNPAGISDVQSMELKLGALHTDYDCMYMGRGNQFYTDGDGGYINLSMTYDGGACNFDRGTGDLSCK